MEPWFSWAWLQELLVPVLLLDLFLGFLLGLAGDLGGLGEVPDLELLGV